ncbi:hypothetical protein SH580_12845 [Coraliomargarita algicola]|uniref:Uncharacterized protein n=1 Tax=Coraliomargarita algicola TaxID=3092156 RepID=A0ABZ0RMZ7_9BACT|nr:hypothetical protein [Coraliomargarita sp. J2-16]WPJ94324.1 hypothetical protein SH580_12845 [Coraliomargarita sp. J2-16]
MKSIASLFSTLILGVLLGQMAFHESSKTIRDTELNIQDAEESSAITEWQASPPVLASESSWNNIYSTMTLIDQSDAQGLASIAVALTEQTEAPIAKTALEMTVRRWAELDRDGALEFAKSHLQATEESRALSAILRIWTSEDSQAAWMSATESGTDSRLKKKMQQTIISQLAITDPLHALHLMSHSELSSVRNDSALIVSIFHQLATEDAESAIIEADQLTTASKRDAYGAILAYLGANAPSRGLELLETLPNTASIAWSYQQSFVSSWVKKDLQAAGRQLIAMESSELQNQLIGAFMSRAAYRDIDATLEWAEKNNQNPALDHGWRSLMWALARSDLDKGIALISNDGLVTPQARDGFLKSWLTINPQEVANWSQLHLDSNEITDIFRHDIRQITQSAPSAAMQLIDLMSPGDARDSVIQQNIYGLAAADTMGTLNWVLTQPDDAIRQAALQNVIGSWANIEPEQAAAYTFENFSENSILLVDLAKSVASNWAKHAPSEALIWARAIKAEEIRQEAVGYALSAWARNDNTAAGNYILAMPADEARSSYIRRHVLFTTKDNPQKALEWIEALPEQEKTDSVTQSFVAGWVGEDSLAASEWVNSLAEGHQRDVAATELVGQIHQKSPKDALPWAYSIENEKLRNQALGNIASGASRLDQAVVQEAINAMTLPEKQMKWYRERYLKE